MRKTARALLAEYGAVAVVVYFAIFFAVLAGFWAGVRFGWRPATPAGNPGAHGAG